MQKINNTAMETKHIVTIDPGTTKTALTVTEISGNNVEIVFYKKIPSEGIRYSYVFNSKQAGDTIRTLVQEAEKELQIKIRSAVVGMPKYSIRKEAGDAEVVMNPEECITRKNVEDLKSDALRSYPVKDSQNEELYGAIAQSFSNGDEIGLTEDDIVGVSCDCFSGDFNLYVGKKKYLSNINVAFKRIGLEVQQLFFTPEAMGKALLTKGEMDSGVALVDIGGGATSVSVYYKGILRHFASIPFGGKSVTADIMTECMISEDIAEKIKTGFGGCMPDKLQNLSEKTLFISSDSEIPGIQIPVKFLSEIITARMKEIIEAILYEIQCSGFADNLRSGVVLTGGGAKLLNCANWFKELSGYETRVGRTRSLFSAAGCEDFFDTDAAVSAGLILAAKDAGTPDSLKENPETAGVNSPEPNEDAGIPEENAGTADTGAGDDGNNVSGTVFDPITEEETREAAKKTREAAKRAREEEKKKGEKGNGTQENRTTWKIRDLFNGLFDSLGNEEA